MNPALEPAFKFLRTPVGRLILLVGGLTIVVVVAAVEGKEERRHPTVFLANVFSVPLEACAGAQTVTVPSHGSASIKLDDPGSPIRIVYQGRDVDHFSLPYTFGVLNIPWSRADRAPGGCVGATAHPVDQDAGNPFASEGGLLRRSRRRPDGCR